MEDSGLDGEGIYRLSGVKSKVDYLKQLYNEGEGMVLTMISTIFVVLFPDNYYALLTYVCLCFGF